ncbi:MAG: histidine kinase dimerization/phospho-acceptor domain-containing protein [bacterium]
MQNPSHHFMEFLLEQVLGALPEGLFLVSPENTVKYLNPSAERIAGVSLSHAEGRPFSELFPAAPDLQQRIRNTLATGHGYTIREDELLNRNGEAWVVEIHIEPVHDVKGIISGAMLLLRDLSAVKKMEEELRHADRLGVMGTIASGLAHEIKNPLGGIKGAAQMLSREVKNNDLREYLQIIVKEADRVNELICELLTFASPQKTRMAAVNMNKLLDELVRLEQQATGGQEVRIVRHYDLSPPKVKGDEGIRIEASLLKLISRMRGSRSRKTAGGGDDEARHRLSIENSRRRPPAW